MDTWNIDDWGLNMLGRFLLQVAFFKFIKISAGLCTAKDDGILERIVGRYGDGEVVTLLYETKGMP